VAILTISMVSKKIIVFGVLLALALVLGVVLIYNGFLGGISANFAFGQKEQINIGLIFPLSGKYANIGIPEKDGIVAAFADINYLVGGNKVNLLIEDNVGDVKSTVDSYNFIKSQSNIVFTSLTPMAIAINELSKIDKTILLYLSTAETMALENEYTFKNHLSIDKEAKVLANVVEGKIGVVYYSGLQGQVFLDELQKHTGKINNSFSFEPGVNDFRTIILKLKDVGVDTLFFIGYPNDSLNFLKQSKEFRFSPKKMALAASSFPEVVNEIEKFSPIDSNVIIATCFEETDFDYKFGYGFAELLIYGMQKCYEKGFEIDDPNCLKETMKNVSFKGKYNDIETDEYGIVQTESKLYIVKNKTLIPFENN
jgi:hypothetical protein